MARRHEFLAVPGLNSSLLACGDRIFAARDRGTAVELDKASMLTGEGELDKASMLTREFLDVS